MAGSAWTNQVQNRVVVGGANGGVFVYSGTPAAGNLIASMAGAAGTDSFGNIYVAGDASYAATFATAINGGQIAWYTGSLSTGWTSVATGTAHVVSPSGVVFSAAGEIVLTNSSGSSGLSIGTAVGPNVTVLSGAVSAITAGVPGAANTVETWHAMSPLLNGWAAGAGNVAPQYRAVASPPNSVEVIGVLNAAAATASTFFTLPAAYRPASQQQFAVGANSGVTAGNSAFIQIATSGNLTVIGVGIGAANTVVYHGFISLDA